MIPTDVIARKREEIPHSQMAVLFMAIYFKRMTEDETFGMVEAIINSGAT